MLISYNIIIHAGMLYGIASVHLYSKTSYSLQHGGITTQSVNQHLQKLQVANLSSCITCPTSFGLQTTCVMWTLNCWKKSKEMLVISHNCVARSSKNLLIKLLVTLALHLKQTQRKLRVSSFCSLVLSKIYSLF